MNKIRCPDEAAARTAQIGAQIDTYTASLEAWRRDSAESVENASSDRTLDELEAGLAKAKRLLQQYREASDPESAHEIAVTLCNAWIHFETAFAAGVASARCGLPARSADASRKS